MRVRRLGLKPFEPSEAEIQKRLIAGLSRRGWLIVRVNSGGHKTATGFFFRAYIIAGLCDENGKPAISGFPDLLAMRGSCFKLLEVKAHDGVRSEAQERFAEFASARGVCVEVVRGWAEAEEMLARLA